MKTLYKIIKTIIKILLSPFILLKNLLIFENNRKDKINTKSIYHIKKQTITNNEQYFLNIIKKHFNDKYDIRVQVPLSSVIEKEKKYENEYQNELNRIIDIGIFNLNTTTPLLLIEINDRTHNKNNRKERDEKVKNICEQAGLPLIAFWTTYTNTEKYITNRINKYLNIDKTE